MGTFLETVMGPMLLLLGLCFLAARGEEPPVPKQGPPCAVKCNDFNPCTVDECDEEGACQNRPLCADDSLHSKCSMSICTVREGRGECVEAFNADKCKPLAKDDTVIFNGAADSADVTQNDWTFGRADDFVWVPTGNARVGLRMTARGIVSVAKVHGPRSRQFQYRLCLKSGAGCWGPATVTVHLAFDGASVEDPDAGEQYRRAIVTHQEEEAESFASGLMQRPSSWQHQHWRRDTASVAPAGAAAADCVRNGTDATVGNLVCAFEPGCPYGYDDDWQCRPQPVSQQCIDAAWKSRLAELWVDYFGDSTKINVWFDGLTRQQAPCNDCEQGVRTQ